MASRLSEEVVPVGTLLGGWRKARRLSQLELSALADVSQRHLSFLETGRSRPSREMILHLGAMLDVPLRAQNELLVAGGFAPVHPQSSPDDQSFDVVRQMLVRLLESHRPFPAIMVDRIWNVVEANAPAALLLGAVGSSSAAVTEPPNLIRMVFHPDGLRGAIANWQDAGPAFWKRLLAEQTANPFDRALGELIEEVSQWHDFDRRVGAHPVSGSVATTIDLRLGEEVVKCFSTVVQVASPVDVVVEELSVELFFPADEPSRLLLSALGGGIDD